jgi:hypothetical protein
MTSFARSGNLFTANGILVTTELARLQPQSFATVLEAVIG